MVVMKGSESMSCVSRACVSMDREAARWRRGASIVERLVLLRERMNLEPLMTYKPLERWMVWMRDGWPTREDVSVGGARRKKGRGVNNEREPGAPYTAR
jgi:hypothetical protein